MNHLGDGIAIGRDPFKLAMMAASVLPFCVLLTGTAAASTDHWAAMSTIDPGNVYRDDIPVLWLVPDPAHVDAQTGVSDDPANGKLLVFLHGTGGSGNQSNGTDHENFLHQAAGLGYHVIALDYYQSQNPPRNNCGCDTYCYGHLRQEQFDGTFHSCSGNNCPLNYGIYPQESVAARLLTVLRWLDAGSPADGWDGFLNSVYFWNDWRSQIRWSSVVFAGHSQGAGLAAYIAKKEPVGGVLLLSGIMDSTNEQGAHDQQNTYCATTASTNSVPYWVTDNQFAGNTGTQWATSSLDRFYGIRGLRDGNTTNADASSATRQSWEALGLGTAHLPGYSDGYGVIDGDTNDYQAKGRHGLYMGSTTNSTFALRSCMSNADCRDGSTCVNGMCPSLNHSGAPGYPNNQPASTETCQATHTATVAGSTPGVCYGGNWHGTFQALKDAWIYVLDKLAAL